MIEGSTSFVKACKDFFQMPTGPGLVAEFQALTAQDKDELRTELIREGYDVQPLGAPAAQPALVGV